MKQNYTHIALLLDCSGSMEQIAEDTKKGYNKFIKDQKELSGDCTVTLVHFNSYNYYNLRYDFMALKSVKRMTEYDCNGCTPLLMAMNKLIDETGKSLAAMREEDRPERVLVVIMTDGEENSSVGVTWEEVAAKIKHQEEVYSWKVVYLGANQDAIAVGDKVNIAKNSTLDFSSTSVGTKCAFDAISTGATAYRSCANAGEARAMNYFDDTARKAQRDLVAPRS